MFSPNFCSFPPGLPISTATPTSSANQPLTRPSLLAFCTSSANLPVTRKSRGFSASSFCLSGRLAKRASKEAWAVARSIKSGWCRKLAYLAWWVADWVRGGGRWEQQHRCSLYKLGWTGVNWFVPISTNPFLREQHPFPCWNQNTPIRPSHF